ncbi:MAG: hypothetical protein JWL64_1464, partial [Frankiales bacterium]|nr:hypothetical protein [Frankiales bacterium]
KPPAPAAPAPVSAGSAYEARLLTLVNQARAQNGLAPLALNGCAQAKARSGATAQAAADTMAHQALGPVLSACHASQAGENVAYGNISADQMFTNWMNSPGHRANILNPAFNAMGNGAAETASGRVYGCQVFLTV